MLNRESYIKKIDDVLAWLLYSIEFRGYQNLYDGHIISEDFMAGLLNVVFGYNLENLNSLHSNYPGIDLGDPKNGIAFQVTAEKSSRKIQNTIDKFISNELYKVYQQLYFIILSKTYNPRSIFDTKGFFEFTKKKHIIDFKHLLNTIKGLDTEKLERIANFLEVEISFRNTVSGKIAPPPLGKIHLSPHFVWMQGIDKRDPTRYFIAPRAHSIIFEEGIRFNFDITNPNKIDMRIMGFHIHVIEYVDVEVIDVWARGMGGGVMMRKYDCKLMPRKGRYECSKASDGFDFIRLSEGEMEIFSLELQAKRPGLYKIQVEVEYSIGGQTHKAKSEDIVNLAFFDFSKYDIRITRQPITANERI